MDGLTHDCACLVPDLQTVQLHDLRADLGYLIGEVPGSREVYNHSYHKVDFVVVRGKRVHVWTAGFTEDGGMMWCYKGCSKRHYVLGAWNVRGGLQYVYAKGGVGCPAKNSDASTSK